MAGAAVLQRRAWGFLERETPALPWAAGCKDTDFNKAEVKSQKKPARGRQSELPGGSGGASFIAEAGWFEKGASCVWARHMDKRTFEVPSTL